MEKEAVYEILEEAYFSDNRHEDKELKLLGSLIQGVDIFVDAGASLGPYTREANEVLENARIVSIEADPIRFERLAENCKAWSQSSTNTLNPVHCAVGGNEGTVRFLTSSTNVSGSLTPIEGRVDAEAYAEVQMTTLDAIIGASGKKIFIKMDVEGAEFKAVEGALKLIRENDVDFLIELHSWGDSINNKYPHDLLVLFKRNGYHIGLTHEHYLFSKAVKPAERKSFLVHYLLWWAKRHLRNVPLAHKLKKLLRG